MSWYAQLKLNYREQTGKTLLDFSHDGPLRILQSLYPEGDAVCHNVLVHPPGGVAGGDVLEVNITVGEHSHALITTPGATRFYKTDGESALQRTRISLAEGARLEWLPLENIAYSGCIAENRLEIELAPTAQMIGWDITALGLRAAHQPFDRGRFTLHTEVMNTAHPVSAWLERGCIAAADQRLLKSPLGMNGHTCIATLFFIAGSAINAPATELFLSKSREIAATGPLARTTGITKPHQQVIVLRAVCDNTEEAMNICKQVRGAWRQLAWDLPATLPRIWAM